MTAAEIQKIIGKDYDNLDSDSHRLKLAKAYRLEPLSLIINNTRRNL
jgi:hypothetical protein